MTNIIEFWQYYDFLYPKQSIPYVLLFGLILSLIINPTKISILNLSHQSKLIFNSNLLFKKIYSRYQVVFAYFWILIISTLSASLIYLILKASSLITIRLSLLLQVFFAWQAFPVKHYTNPILQANRIFQEEGTMIGLSKLRQNLNKPLAENTIIEMYQITLRDYLMQVTLYWFIPFIVLFFGFWPFVFFYLAFIIQYRSFNLNSKILNIILSLPHTIITALMRFIFIFCKGESIEKREFKDLFLSYGKIFLSERQFAEEMVVNPDQQLKSTVNSRKSNKGEKYQEINLRYLSYVETLCLGSMTIIAGSALLIFYLRAVI